MTLNRRQLEQLLDEGIADLDRSFFESWRDMVAAITLADVIRGVERGDVPYIVEAMNMNPAYLAPLGEAIRRQHTRMGQAAMAAFPQVRPQGVPATRLRFDTSNPRAQAAIARHTTEILTEVVGAQAGAVQLVLQDGLERGLNPRETGLNLVGRADRRGVRTGGIVGIDEYRAGWVVQAGRELQSDRPEMLQRFLSRRLAPAAGDYRAQRILRAIAAERPLTAQEALDALEFYEGRVLRLRGETIARTETLFALSAAQQEAMEQAVDFGAIHREDVTRVWDATLDARTRPDHRAVHGQRRGMEEPFSVGGELLQYPGTGSARQRINCRCLVRYDADFITSAER